MYMKPQISYDIYLSLYQAVIRFLKKINNYIKNKERKKKIRFTYHSKINASLFLRYATLKKVKAGIFYKFPMGWV